MNTLHYPTAPVNVDPKISNTSPGFKREVLRTMGAIIFFMVVYLLLVTAAIGLALLLSYFGFRLVVAVPKFITLTIGLGLIGVGLMVVFFLLKFIFKTNKTDRSGLLAVTREQQPDLFSFIEKITNETGTPFPKKIYLSQDVNACVFYDSSFWSMFFPIQKNLQIGLGLVNSLDLREFKGVLAHEFGHFSQRSMKLGSYTYNVNKIIFDMLYLNEGYQKTLESWGSWSGIFAFFATVTVRIVMEIQFILRKVYAVVNKSYMGLSRQMEFHADAIACSVTGSVPMVNSLLKIEATHSCYQALMGHYNSWLTNNLKPDNIYPQHTEVMKGFALQHHLPFSNGLFRNEGEIHFHFVKSRLVVKDQWASHPSTEDRVAHLRQLNVQSESSESPAWSVFRNVEELQKMMTDKLYEPVKFEGPVILLDKETFAKKYAETNNANSYSDRFKGFYDQRIITSFDLNEILQPLPGENGLSLESLFTDSNVTLPSIIRSLEQDLATLDFMEAAKQDQSFDFDGVKYRQRDIPAIREKLNGELLEAKIKLEALDKMVFRAFYQKATSKGSAAEVLTELKTIQDSSKEFDNQTSRYRLMMEALQPIYSPMQPQAIKVAMAKIKIMEEPFREDLRAQLNDPAFVALVDKGKERLDKYLSGKWEYYIEPDYHQTNLNLLTESLDIYINAIVEKNFRIKKELLEKQAAMFAN